jgi:hypothetical protein
MRTSRSISRSTSKTPRSKTALARSISSPRREAAVLRRGRERIEDEARVDESSARTSVAARRISSA